MFVKHYGILLNIQVVNVFILKITCLKLNTILNNYYLTFGKKDRHAFLMHSFILLSHFRNKILKTKVSLFPGRQFWKHYIYEFFKYSLFWIQNNFIILLHNKNYFSLLSASYFAYLSQKPLFLFVYFLVNLMISYYLLMVQFLSTSGRTKWQIQTHFHMALFSSSTSRLMGVKIQTDVGQHLLRFWFSDIMDAYRLDLGQFLGRLWGSLAVHQPRHTVLDEIIGSLVIIIIFIEKFSHQTLSPASVNHILQLTY